MRRSKRSFEWKCGCKTDGFGTFEICGTSHDNLLTETLNNEEMKE